MKYKLPKVKNIRIQNARVPIINAKPDTALNVRLFSGMEEKNAENVFQTSPTTAVHALQIFPSFDRGAIFMMNSTNPRTVLVWSTRVRQDFPSCQ